MSIAVIIRTVKYTAFLWAFTWLLSGCLGVKHLEGDEKLLAKQEIKGKKKLKDYELNELLRQQPNDRFIFSFVPIAPYVQMYYLGKNPPWPFKGYDQERLKEKKERLDRKFESRIDEAEGNPKKLLRLERKLEKKTERLETAIENGNQVMRWGEPLAIFSEEKMENSKAQLKQYLFSKGYFQNQVNTRIDTFGRKNRKVKVSYLLEPGEPYLLDTFYYASEDEKVVDLLQSRKMTSKLETGINYDEDAFEAERARIESTLRNWGYYTFSRQYVEYFVDSAWGQKKVAAEVRVNVPPEQNEFPVFTIDSVNFILDANVQTNRQDREKELYDGIVYQYYDNKYSKKILNRRIFVYPGNLFSDSARLNTQRQLGNLDIFKFININYDSSGQSLIANIFTSSLPSWQMTHEIGVNVTYGLPGPFYRITLRKRNIFGGLENFEISGNYGLEGVAAATDITNVYGSTQAGANMSLIFPQFVFPFSPRFKSRMGSNNPKTRLLVGYDFINRPEYERTNINSSITYTWQRKNKFSYSFTPLEISLINSRTSDEFDSLLQDLQQQGNNLINSFRPSFVSSAHFWVNIDFNNYGSYQTQSPFLRLYGEIGGLSQNLFTPNFIERQELETYRYAKFNTDFRFHKPLKRNRQFAFRVNLGVAYPYGDNSALPYEKYFFIGGSNSVRAWRPRRLGPGSFTPPVLPDGTFDYSFEQPGELIMETSVEWRGKLVGLLDYGLFIDAGNIWSLQSDVREGARFGTDFWREIAVGVGMGLRLNFDFFVIRFDAGIKTVDPAREIGKRFVLDNFFRNLPFGEKEQMILNLAIGYPF